MFCLSKKTDYALIALAFMGENPQRVWPSREIAQACALPRALVTKILKELHQAGILQSSRGSTGGYHIAADLEKHSLHDLIQLLEQSAPAARVLDESPDSRIPLRRRANLAGPAAAPIQALHYKFRRFLSDVKLSDLLMPGRRIDVPLERLNCGQNTGQLQSVK
jgi:Rrf2 family protein